MPIIPLDILGLVTVGADPLSSESVVAETICCQAVAAVEMAVVVSVLYLSLGKLRIFVVDAETVRGRTVAWIPISLKKLVAVTVEAVCCQAVAVGEIAVAVGEIAVVVFVVAVRIVSVAAETVRSRPRCMYFHLSQEDFCCCEDCSSFCKDGLPSGCRLEIRNCS